ncbi:hypothetical protein QWZ08_06405 [Ferruginibacter paludis]|uniref:hypothetical protein n=1 Tax=Ferruginibacter paludis TaxID=1310417 RepID=UPI0025B45D5D|nr:hypothetical protein [Ferruginibacter paludis]MDN3655245.1 hypothetical protein [Ferruginibacter paludis]
MKKMIAILSLLFTGGPFISEAHPGHGSTEGFTITHYFTEPVHVIVSLSIIVAAAIFIRYRSAVKQPVKIK